MMRVSAVELDYEKAAFVHLLSSNPIKTTKKRTKPIQHPQWTELGEQLRVDLGPIIVHQDTHCSVQVYGSFFFLT